MCVFYGSSVTSGRVHRVPAVDASSLFMSLIHSLDLTPAFTCSAGRESVTAVTCHLLTQHLPTGKFESESADSNFSDTADPAGEKISQINYANEWLEANCLKDAFRLDTGRVERSKRVDKWKMQRNKVRDNDGLQSETYRISEWGGACVTRYVCYETFSGRALEGSTSVGSLSAAGGTLRRSWQCAVPAKRAHCSSSGRCWPLVSTRIRRYELPLFFTNISSVHCVARKIGSRAGRLSWQPAD